MKRTTRILSMCGILMVVWLVRPETSLACEKCFGAAVDSPVVYAIGFSMLALLVTIIFVWGGIIAFFNNVERRGRLLANGLLFEAAGCDPSMLDGLLDKINRTGYEGLTAGERACLEEISTT